MLKKQQLSLLKNNKQIIQNNFKPLYQSKQKYQRNKQDLIIQLLNYYNDKSINKLNNNNKKQHNIEFIKQISTIKIKQYSIFNKSILKSINLNPNQYRSNQSYEKIQSENIYKNILNQQEKSLYLNQYMQQLKKTKQTIKSQRYKLSQPSNSKYQIMDKFIKNKINVFQSPDTYCQETNISYIVNKNEENQNSKIKDNSTFLQKFYKTNITPHRKMKRTQSYDRSKTKSISKQQNIKIVKQQPKIYKISHNQNIKNKSKNLKNEVKIIKIDLLNSLNKKIQQKSKQINNKTNNKLNHDFNKAIINEKNNLQKDYYQRNNYDQQSNILDHIQKQSKITDFQHYYQDIKQTFKIKNQSQFQIESKTPSLPVEKLKPKKKQKNKIFDGCQQENYRKFLEKQKIYKLDDQKQSQESEGQIKQDKKNENSSKISLISYLRQKTKLSKNVPNNQIKKKQIKNSKQNSIKHFFNNYKNKIEFKQTKQNKQKQNILKEKDLQQHKLQENKSNDSNERRQNNHDQHTIVKQSSNNSNNLSSNKQQKNKEITPKTIIKSSQSKKQFIQQKTQLKKQAFQKIFGTTYNDKKNQICDKDDLFSRNLKNEGQIISRPSTVLQVQQSERSDDKSELIRNIQQLIRKDSFAGQLDQQSSHNQQKKEQDYKNYQQSDFINQDKVQHSNSNFNQYSDFLFSQNAISFNKFPNVSQQQQYYRDKNSFEQQNDSDNKSVKNFDELQQQNQYSSQNVSHSSEEGQANFQQLEDYDSDEQKENKNKKNHFPEVLPSVIEEDLQQTQFKQQKIPYKNLHNQQKQKQKIKQLEQQFLKDFNLQKKVSQVDQFKIQNSQILRLSKTKQKIQFLENKKNRISIDNNLEDKKFDSSIFSLIQDQASSQNLIEQNLIKGIKDDVLNLKLKIQSSFQSQRQQKIQKLNLSFNNQSSKNEQSKSFSKIFQQKSLSLIKKDKSNSQVRSNKSDIDFNKINEEINEKVLYTDIKRQFSNLKKKIQLDAGIL